MKFLYCLTNQNKFYLNKNIQNINFSFETENNNCFSFLDVKNFKEK